MIRQALAHLLDAIADRLDPEKDDYENDGAIVVATGHYATQVGEGQAAHFASFVTYEDGDRNTITDTAFPHLAEQHGTLLFDRMDWKVHGVLPTTARMVNPKPTGKLILLAGGKAGANEPPDGAA